MNKQKGFTLIELLVVIAIIAILSGIVIAALGTSREKARDAAIASELNALRTNAELFSSGSSNNYGLASSSCYDNTAGTLWADTTIRALITAMDNLNGTRNLVCNSTPTAWAAYAFLNEGVGTGMATWCVDSTSYSSKKVGTPFPGLGDQDCD